MAIEEFFVLPELLSNMGRKKNKKKSTTTDPSSKNSADKSLNDPQITLILDNALLTEEQQQALNHILRYEDTDERVIDSEVRKVPASDEEVNEAIRCKRKGCKCKGCACKKNGVTCTDKCACNISACLNRETLADKFAKWSKEELKNPISTNTFESRDDDFGAINIPEECQKSIDYFKLFFN
jgi:hypothetical protein